LFAYVAGNPLSWMDPRGLDLPKGLFPEVDAYKYPISEEDVPDLSIDIGEALKHGWESGYYKCILKCMTLEGGVFAPAVMKGLEKIVAHGVENAGGAEWIAQKIYTLKYPKWFKAGGKSSKVLVPKLAGYLKSGAKALSVLGWAVFDLELFECINKCMECL
jgi:hypothetical protein